MKQTEATTSVQRNTPADPLIERYLEYCHRKSFLSKATILRQGDVANELLYIVKGSVIVHLEVYKGHEIVLAYLNRGEFFGEAGLFNEHSRRTAMVRARTPCEIACISYEKLKSMPSLYMEVSQRIAAQLSVRLRKTNRKVGDIAFADVKRRVFRTLWDLCEEPDAMTHPQGKQIRITRQELGRIVGCSREMVGRVLKDLEEGKKIHAKGKTIVVYPPPHG